jgi:hypothetical protein
MESYLDGELAGTESLEFEEHLAGCPACRRELDERRRLNAAAADLPPVEVPPGFAAAILAALPVERRRPFARLVPAAFALAVLFAALLAYHLITGESLVGVLLSVGRSVIGFFSLAAPPLAKLLKLAGVFVTLAGNFGAAFVRGGGILFSLLKPGMIGLGLVLGLGLSLLFAVGVKKIVSLGEKP